MPCKQDWKIRSLRYFLFKKILFGFGSQIFPHINFAKIIMQAKISTSSTKPSPPYTLVSSRIYKNQFCMRKVYKGREAKRERRRRRKMACCGRPNRSDVHLSNEEEAEMESKTREYFDGVNPKRHTKPQRSEYTSSQYVDALSNPNNEDSEIPELVEFQRLENDTEKIVVNGSEVGEEFVETEYYKDLNCVDKQHHTTGTGFIKVPNKSDKNYNLAPDTNTDFHASCQCNPATNDWVPDAADSAPLPSGKPGRSEN